MRDCFQLRPGCPQPGPSPPAPTSVLPTCPVCSLSLHQSQLWLCAGRALFSRCVPGNPPGCYKLHSYCQARALHVAECLWNLSSGRSDLVPGSFKPPGGIPQNNLILFLHFLQEAFSKAKANDIVSGEKRKPHKTTSNTG